MQTAILADDHAIVRDGMKSLLEGSGRVKVIGEASNGIEALELVKKLHPDLLITDVTMPNMNGIELTEKAVEAAPAIRVLVFTMHENEDFILKSFENGASGYLLKDADRDEIFRAIETISEGKKYYDARASKLMMQGIIRNARGESDEAQAGRLSKRELEVLKFVVEGHTSNQIAQTLFISTRTVDSHRTNIMQKLKVKNTAELVKTAFKLNLIE